MTVKEQRQRLGNSHSRKVDLDTWLWGKDGPDFVAELGREVLRIAGSDSSRKGLCEGVAARLLDHRRVRIATAEECAKASRILTEVGNVDTALGDAEVLRLLTEKAVEVAGDDADRVACYSVVARQVARRMASCGVWDELVEDDVPPELQPLHMSAVREALGALIPEALHKSMDKAAQKMKDDFGVVRGGSVLFMDGWQVNVRAEDALASGRLREDAMEFFWLILKHV